MRRPASDEDHQLLQLLATCEKLSRAADALVDRLMTDPDPPDPGSDRYRALVADMEKLTAACKVDAASVRGRFLLERRRAARPDIIEARRGPQGLAY